MTPEQLRHALKKRLPDALSALDDVLTDPKTPHATRADLAKWMVDHVIGKPTQATLSVETNISAANILSAIRQRAISNGHNEERKALEGRQLPEQSGYIEPGDDYQDSGEVEEVTVTFCERVSGTESIESTDSTPEGDS